jgi:peptidoglycan/xylan/chitin deacetylase (PgdA/CDA1 family)
VSHTDNSKLSEEEEAHEMCDSRNTLEGIARQKIETYIYPSGKVNPEIDEITAKKCGYMLAWSTSFGSDYNGHTGSLYDLNRIRITSSADSRFFDTILERKPTK